MKKILQIGSIGIVVAALTVITPPVYNNYFSPLAIIRAKIKPQSTYTDVERLFVKFYATNEGTEAVQFARGETKHHLFKGPVTPTQHLFLYHESYFDDLQLQVLFDADNRITEVLFVAD